MQIDYEDKQKELIELLEDFLGEPRKHYENKEQISFDCPNCSDLKGVDYDGKGNLEVNYGSGVYKCWSCAETHETQGKIYNLFKTYADKDILKRFISGKYQFNNDYYPTVIKPVSTEKLKLPEETFFLNGNQKHKEFFPAFGYLYERGLNDKIIDKFKIGFCFEGKYQNRVIIPSYDANGDLNYFVTRTISKVKSKYNHLNPEIDKTSIIFNELFIDWDKPIFLVEGAFDHVVVPNSIPLLGKKLYDKLFDALYFKAKNFIIVALDGDALEDGKKIFNRLDAGRLRNRVLLNKMPEDEDLSSYYQKYGPLHLKQLLQKNYKLND
jgi:DNA primase